MPAISAGMRQRPVTPFFYAGWNKAKLKIMPRLKKSTKLEEQMLKGMFLRSVHPLNTYSLKSKRLKIPKVCHASITTRVRVPTSNPMTRGELCICTHCFITSGKTFTHPESQCRNKQKKNRQKKNNLRYES